MRYLSRKIVMPGNLNGASTLFGGQALAWIDEEAAVYAACQLKTTRLVTKAMSEVVFTSPARLGDMVEFGCQVVAIGRTSITIACTIRNKTTKEEIVKVDKIVFVSLDEDGRPKPHGVTEVTPFEDD